MNKINFCQHTFGLLSNVRDVNAWSRSEVSIHYRGLHWLRTCCGWAAQIRASNKILVVTKILTRATMNGHAGLGSPPLAHSKVVILNVAGPDGPLAVHRKSSINPWYNVPESCNLHCTINLCKTTSMQYSFDELFVGCQHSKAVHQTFFLKRWSVEQERLRTAALKQQVTKIPTWATSSGHAGSPPLATATSNEPWSTTTSPDPSLNEASFKAWGAPGSKRIFRVWDWRCRPGRPTVIGKFWDIIKYCEKQKYGVKTKYRPVELEKKQYVEFESRQRQQRVPCRVVTQQCRSRLRLLWREYCPLSPRPRSSGKGRWKRDVCKHVTQSLREGEVRKKKNVLRVQDRYVVERGGSCVPELVLHRQRNVERLPHPQRRFQDPDDESGGVFRKNYV